MFKQFKFLLTVLFSAVLTISVMTACNAQQNAGSGSRTVTMATSADYPPYEFVDSSSGSQEIIGFDVDIAKEITGRLGYGLQIQNIDFNGLIPALQAKRADFVMAGMTPTEERKQNVDFSRVYYEAKNTIVARQGSNFNAPSALRGKTVGVQLGTIQEEAANDLNESQNLGMTVKPLNRINEIVQELKAGRIEAAIVEDTVAKGYVQSNPDLEFNTIPNEGASGSAIAFPKDSELREEFDRVLGEMIDSGKITELVNKWFGDQAPTQAAQ
jgi:polar amino acid transport system substrate-binding protein